MSNQNNPFASQGGYSTTMSFGNENGSAEPSRGTADPVAEVTTANFAAEVIKESRNRPVLVDFWAPWCGPCKQLAPALEKVVAETRGAVRLVKMNIDEHPAVAGQLGIQSIPAVIAFRDGRPVDGFMGAVPESQIRDFIKRLGAGNGANGIEEAMAAAEVALAEGDLQSAADIYTGVLAEAPEALEAVAGLAGIHLDLGDAERAEALIAGVDEASKDAPALASVKARLALLAQTADLGDETELEARLAKNPKDHEARFDLAMLRNAKGDRESAADHLLSIVKADRTWRDDGARAQLLQFFEAWGMTDPATLQARRKLSSLLFS